ncbi:hypothetical protein ANCCAN_23492 [Ancylostoma caninum]|uniref:EGF-like domain-containing protein n=1 Tax=Ancylostoma caninum TaxID=29170 RepID=A0A368FEY2_ANCCA|nr:hypothetical protein ANCCAN_23492 [Ancylostoma caninum]
MNPDHSSSDESPEPTSQPPSKVDIQSSPRSTAATTNPFANPKSQQQSSSLLPSTPENTATLGLDHSLGSGTSPTQPTIVTQSPEDGQHGFSKIFPHTTQASGLDTMMSSAPTTGQQPPVSEQTTTVTAVLNEAGKTTTDPQRGSTSVPPVVTTTHGGVQITPKIPPSDIRQPPSAAEPTLTPTDKNVMPLERQSSSSVPPEVVTGSPEEIVTTSKPTSTEIQLPSSRQSTTSTGHTTAVPPEHQPGRFITPSVRTEAPGEPETTPSLASTEGQHSSFSGTPTTVAPKGAVTTVPRSQAGGSSTLPPGMINPHGRIDTTPKSASSASQSSLFPGQSTPVTAVPNKTEKTAIPPEREPTSSASPSPKIVTDSPEEVDTASRSTPSEAHHPLSSGQPTSVNGSVEGIHTTVPPPQRQTSSSFSPPAITKPQKGVDTTPRPNPSSGHQPSLPGHTTPIGPAKIGDTTQTVPHSEAGLPMSSTVTTETSTSHEGISRTTEPGTPSLHQKSSAEPKLTTRMPLVIVDGVMNPDVKMPDDIQTLEQVTTVSSSPETTPTSTETFTSSPSSRKFSQNPEFVSNTPASVTPTDMPSTVPNRPIHRLGTNEMGKMNTPTRSRSREEVGFTRSTAPADVTSFASTSSPLFPTSVNGPRSPETTSLSTTGSPLIPDRRTVPSGAPSDHVTNTPSPSFTRTFPSPSPTNPLHSTEFDRSTTAPSTAPRSSSQSTSSTNAPPTTLSTSIPEQDINPPNIADSGIRSTTEDDLSVVVESFESTTGSPNDLAPKKRGRCTLSDRSMCHELAICEIATGACRCKDGFTGDGYTNCT